MKKKGIVLKPVLVVIVALLISIPGLWLAISRLEGKAPVLEIAMESPFIGAASTVGLSVEDVGSGVRSVWVGLWVDGQELALVQRSFPSAGFFVGGSDKSVHLEVTVSPKSLGLADGKALMRVVARDYSLRQWGKGNQTYWETEIQIDTQPPVIELISRAHNLAQGGSGVAIYRLSEACPVSGVAVGEHFYPGYAGHFEDPSVHLAFFALDYRQGKGTQLAVAATDYAGNQSTSSLVHHINPRSFKKDTLNLSDTFLNASMPGFERFFPELAGGSPVELFLRVNRDLRLRDDDAIFQATRQPQREMLWSGTFLRLPRSASRAGFADQRTYLYGGKEIDQQVHLGIDLASTAHSPVPAANRGKVVFAGEQGIYGNTVIVDHGFGLFTLYSHLSRLDVSVGEMVDRGAPIGNTGMTGLAGGDHLHFSTLIHQTFVNPLEWWDDVWIHNNVSTKIEEAGSK